MPIQEYLSKAIALYLSSNGNKRDYQAVRTLEINYPLLTSDEKYLILNLPTNVNPEKIQSIVTKFLANK